MDLLKNKTGTVMSLSSLETVRQLFLKLKADTDVDTSTFCEQIVEFSLF